MTDHGLSPRHLDLIAGVLAPFADRIDRAGLFGSRATGRARPESDIDLVLYGGVDAGLRDRIWTLFDEAPLELKVDVLAYDLIDHPALKAHVDAVMRPLFTRDQLLRKGAA